MSGWRPTSATPSMLKARRVGMRRRQRLAASPRFVGPENPDVQQQIALIEAAVAKPTTAGILIYSVNDDAIVPVLNKARAAGIPVITGNGELKDKSARDAFVGTANSALGATAADLV